MPEYGLISMFDDENPISLLDLFLYLDAEHRIPEHLTNEMIDYLITKNKSKNELYDEEFNLLVCNSLSLVLN